MPTMVATIINYSAENGELMRLLRERVELQEILQAHITKIRERERERESDTH